MKQSALLERLSKEKPAHEIDEIGEALRRGYSWEQIFRAMPNDVPKGLSPKVFLKYSGVKGNIEIPFSYENYFLLCRLMFG